MQTGPDGKYTFPNLQPGQYTISAGKSGYIMEERAVTLLPGEQKTLDFLLSPAVAGLKRWSSLATWTSAPFNLPGFPKPTDVLLVPSDYDLLLDIEGAQAKKVVVEGYLGFDTTKPVRLDTWGNVEVMGLGWLDMGTSIPVRSVLQINDIDESKFVGGHTHMPLDTDPGVWVMEQGRLTTKGIPKTQYALLPQGAVKGQQKVIVERLVNWSAGDVVALAPSEPPSVAGFSTHYDMRTVQAVSGYEITLDAPLTYDHPTALVGGVLEPPEVFSLSRSVVIQGTPTGRLHVMVMSALPQLMENFEIRHFAPKDGPFGRYGLHDHLRGDNARGTTYRGFVLRDGGGHAAVPHGCNGVTFEEGTCHDTIDEQWWYDRRPLSDPQGPQIVSNDIKYLSPIASLVKAPNTDLRRMGGFALLAGEGNVIEDARGFGIQGQGSSAVYHWPEGIPGLWQFRRNRGHNCLVNIVFIWQNSPLDHFLEDFAGWYAGKRIVDCGAYRNHYRFTRVRIGLAKQTPFASFVSSGKLMLNPVARHTIELSDLTGAGGLYALEFPHHAEPPDNRTLIRENRFRAYTKAAIAWLNDDQFNDDGTPKDELVDVINNWFESPEKAFWLGDQVTLTTDIRAQPDPRTGAGAIRLRRKDYPSGVLFAPWNCKIEAIAPFV